MGWFKQQQDPFSSQSKDLDKKIAKIRAEINQLKFSLGDDEVPAESTPKKTSAPHRKPRQSRPIQQQENHNGQASTQAKNEKPKSFKKRVASAFSKQKPIEERFVSYFAAGSFESARPLRYERRIARNRIIFVTVIVLLFLFTIISFFW